VALLRALPSFRALGHPVLAGVSRKRFIGELAAEPDPARRDPGSIAAALFAAGRGRRSSASTMSRTVQALRVWQALAAA
ncbi:unnamed protein product, partial [Acidocella sp. C78]